MNKEKKGDVTEHAVLFNDEMVQAILAGLKTQTRRPIKPQPRYYPERIGLSSFGPWVWRTDKYTTMTVGEPPNEFCPLKCPYGVPGDTLWVRESWAEGWTYQAEHSCVFYRADNLGLVGNAEHPVRFCHDGNKSVLAAGEGDATAPDNCKWTPSIHMPRWASRINLTVNRVWVERLSEISNADLVAEGIEGYENDSHGMRSEIVGQFMAKWDAIYAKRGLGWDANPWVWACEWEER